MRGVSVVLLGVMAFGLCQTLCAEEESVPSMYSTEYLTTELAGNADAANRKTEGATWLLQIQAFATQAATLDDDAWTAAIQEWTARKHELFAAGGYSGFMLALKIHETISAELCRRAVNEYRDVVSLAEAHQLTSPLCWLYIQALQKESLLQNLDESLLPGGDTETANRILMGMILKRQYPDIYGKTGVAEPEALDEETLFASRDSRPLLFSSIREAFMREDTTLLIAQMYSQQDAPSVALLPDEEASVARMRARGGEVNKVIAKMKNDDSAQRFRWAVREVYADTFQKGENLSTVRALQLNRKRVRIQQTVHAIQAKKKAQ